MLSTVKGPFKGERLISGRDYYKVREELTISTREDVCYAEYPGVNPRDTIGELEAVGNPDQYVAPNLGEATSFAGKIAIEGSN